MITVLCANPALDITYRVEHVTRGAVHAVDDVWRRAGGKGTNVARVLCQLGAPLTLVAPLGEAGGAHYAAELSASGVDLVQVPIASPPRSSVCVLDDDATVFNEPGPQLTAAEWDAVVEATMATRPDVLVLAGSLPVGVPATGYAPMIDATDAITLVDANGAVLEAALAARPDVVAPNLLEARHVAGNADPLDCAGTLRARGAGAAVVSCGPDGLVAATADGIWRVRPPRALHGNPTGAGDALTAALALGLSRADRWPPILRDAVATSAAALGRETAGEIDPALRAELAGQVFVEEIRDGADQHS